MSFKPGRFPRLSPKETVNKAPADWLETLRKSDEDIAAGRVVPVDDVLNELDELIASMDADHSPSP